VYRRPSDLQSDNVASENAIPNSGKYGARETGRNATAAAAGRLKNGVPVKHSKVKNGVWWVNRRVCVRARAYFYAQRA